MNAKMINISLFCQGNRIVQVFGIFAVDSDCLQISQIQSSISVCIQHMIRNTLCLLHYFLREFVWDSEALDDCQNVCARSSDISKVFLDFSLRVLILGTVVCDHCDYFVTIFNSCCFFARDKNVFGKFRVVTDHETKITV